MAADEIRRELHAARAEARRLAGEQQAWRTHVSELYERARDAGIEREEILESLGLGAKWTEHQAKRSALRDRLGESPFHFGAT